MPHVKRGANALISLLQSHSQSLVHSGAKGSVPPRPSAVKQPATFVVTPVATASSRTTETDFKQLLRLFARCALMYLNPFFVVASVVAALTV